MTFDINNLKVGDEVCLVECGANSGRVKAEDGNCRRSRGCVTKVGRKFIYITVEGCYRDIQFMKGCKGEYKKSGYCSDYFIYESEAAYLLEVENKKFYREIKDKYFDHYTDTTLSLDQLKRVDKILGESND